MLYATNNYKNTKNLSNTRIKFYSNHVWRLMYLINSNSVYTTLTKKIYNSSSTIPFMFVGYEVFLYSGNRWLSRFLSKWSMGLKFGILSWNRKIALFKAKQLKKK
jgi:ribosomal protein S19